MRKTAIITGSLGLIGSEAVKFFAEQGYQIIGIDNDLRKEFFGPQASTAWNLAQLKHQVPQYQHQAIDIRDTEKVQALFTAHAKDIQLIIHCAAQPSHDWAAKDPFMDFTVNANGTLNLLEATRLNCPEASFIFTSTNKVYGDTPNYLPLVEQATRWELDATHPYFEHGIPEQMSIDHTTHSLFGVSKASADLMVQEYGRYFGMNTVCFRGGCLTGPAHSGTQLHGFLSYLMLCVIQQKPYTVFGYQGKQVRDNIHAFDLVNAFWHYAQNPQPAKVYNMGGSRHSHCSMLEAITLCEAIAGKKLAWSYQDTARIGDHMWWVSDTSAFQKDYPHWAFQYNLETLFEDIYQGLLHRAA